jgi:hypothetical protein
MTLLSGEERHEACPAVSRGEQCRDSVLLEGWNIVKSGTFPKQVRLYPVCTIRSSFFTVLWREFSVA